MFKKKMTLEKYMVGIHLDFWNGYWEQQQIKISYIPKYRLLCGCMLNKSNPHLEIIIKLQNFLFILYN
jgi:hypothetical protein